MKIIVENREFSFDAGCRLLKLKYEKCPIDAPEISEIWDDIVPFSFKEILAFENLEERRIGIVCLGLERLTNEVKPTLVDKQVIKKQTTWINSNGEFETIDYDDVYNLYRVDGNVFTNGTWRNVEDVYYVECKDTSTDRRYLIWVNIENVIQTKTERTWVRVNRDELDVDAIDCIAWTIQTDVPKNKIEKIVRQGDCILIKPNGKYKTLDRPRHLTKEEYLNLLVCES